MKAGQTPSPSRPASASAPILRGDIYFIDLPAPKGDTDKVQAYPRPCIVVSRTDINATGPTVVVVPMTTVTKKANSFRVQIPKDHINALPGETFTNSVALCDHLRVVNKMDLKRKMGQLSGTAVYAITAGIGFLLDC